MVAQIVEDSFLKRRGLNPSDFVIAHRKDFKHVVRNPNEFQNRENCAHAGLYHSRSRVHKSVLRPQKGKFVQKLERVKLECV